MKDVNKPICYCGSPGDRKKNMLYCLKCKRWLHEECVKCLDVPMLFGDRFYILICSVCNSGSECLARIEMKWADVTHLILYNLSVIHNKTYFDLDGTILPFLIENWLRFHLFGPIAEVKTEEQRSRILGILMNDPRFKSGREIKKSKNIFGLRERAPPEPPPVEPSAAKVKKDVLIWEFHVNERPYKFLTSTKPKKTKDATKNVKSKKKLSTQLRPKQNGTPKTSTDIQPSENTIQKAKTRIKKSTTTFVESSATVGLLDSLIPIPQAFTLENNPFLKSREKRAAKRQLAQLQDKNPSQAESQPIKRDDISNEVEQQPMKRGRQHAATLRLSEASKKASTSKRSSDSDIFFDAKDYFSEEREGGKSGMCVIGKRITRKGKIQYLLQKDR